MRTKTLYVRIPSDVHDALLAEAEAESEQLAVIVRRRLRQSLGAQPPNSSTGSTQPDQQTQEES